MAASPLRSSDLRQLGDYRLLARLGEGGMGTVFLGQSTIGTPVAVKVIRPELADDPEFRARFRREVKRARQVPPFCTAELLDADADHNPPYLVVEYVTGPSLADVVRDRGPLRSGDLHSVAIGVIVALAGIHDAGVVHRDLKPANVLFAPLGTPKVIDFWVATSLDTLEQHTEPGQILGTVAYMAPERFITPAEPSTGTAGDIFAWGALVAHATTGHTPFVPEALVATAAGMPLPEPDLTGLPWPLRGIVRRALREDPESRPSAHDILEELIRKGAPGGSLVPSTNRSRAELKRAAAAVRHTAPLNLTPVDPGTTVEQPQPADRRRHRRRLAIAAASLIATIAAYPVSHRLEAHHSQAHTAGSSAGKADLDARDRDADKASRANRDDRCALDGPLDVTPDHARAFTCPASGNAGNAGNQTVTAKLKLIKAGSCAALWTHINGPNAYRITICAHRVTVDIQQNGHLDTAAMSALDPPAYQGEWHRIQIATPGTGMTVAWDGEVLVTRAHLAQLNRGAISLGAVPAPDHTSPTGGGITYADVTITSTP